MPLNERITSVDELRTWKDRLPLRYEYSAGLAGERFLRGLKEGKILAAKCDRCGKLFLPPKIYCIDCYREMKTFVEVGPGGKVSAVTEAWVDFEGKRTEAPRRMAFVTFKGVQGGLIHSVEGSKTRIGAQVTPRFRPEPERIGSLRDIETFVGP
jgi:uncharacterized OB-fold protein